MVKPYPLGYTALSTDGFNSEDPHCAFGGLKDAGLWLGEQDLPSSIELLVRLIPVWIENSTATAKLGENKAFPLYPPQSVFAKMNVAPMGAGQYQKVSGGEKIPFIGTSFLNYSLDLPQPYLYQKTFLTQPQGRTIQWVPQGMHFLWAYGGAQIEDDIHPLVVTLEAARDETILRPTSLLSCKEQGFFPSKGGDEQREEVSFQDVFEEDQTRTFLESVERGMAHIHLVVGVDEAGKSVKIPYHSYRLSKDYLHYKKGV
jgi:hypothetical protein